MGFTTWKTVLNNCWFICFIEPCACPLLKSVDLVDLVNIYSTCDRVPESSLFTNWGVAFSKCTGKWRIRRKGLERIQYFDGEQYNLALMINMPARKCYPVRQTYQYLLTTLCKWAINWHKVWYAGWEKNVWAVANCFWLMVTRCNVNVATGISHGTSIVFQYIRCFRNTQLLLDDRTERYGSVGRNHHRVWWLLGKLI